MSVWGQTLGGAEKPESFGVEGSCGRARKEAEAQRPRVGPGHFVCPWGRWPSRCLALGGSDLNSSPTWKLSLPSGMGLRRLTL